MALERSEKECPMYSPCIDSTVIKSDMLASAHKAPEGRPVYVGGVIKADFTLENERLISGSAFARMERIQSDAAPAYEQSMQETSEEKRRMLDDAAKTAEKLIEDAKQEALRIREDAEQMASLTIEDSVMKAQAEYDVLREAARQEGLGAGHTEASEAVKKEAATKLAELGAIITSLREKQVKMLSRYENDLAELSVEVARRIIKREVSTDKKILAEMLREVVEDNRRENWVRVTVSENTPPLELVVDDEVLDLITKLGTNVTAAVSRDVKEGLCLVETPGGSINVAMDTQLKNIRKSIREAHTHRS